MLDFDTVTSDDTIVRYRFDLSPSVGSTIISSRSIARSSDTGASIAVSTIVLCAPFYFGSSCQFFNYCQSNAVTCSDRRMCVNEIDSSTCNCNPPYFGANCEHQNFCYNRNCNERGTCTFNGFDSTPVSAMLAILVLIVRWILMSAC